MSVLLSRLLNNIILSKEVIFLSNVSPAEKKKRKRGSYFTCSLAPTHASSSQMASRYASVGQWKVQENPGGRFLHSHWVTS